MSDFPGHIVKSYEQELRQLGDMLVKMGGLVEAQLATATAAVTQGDSAAATAAMEQDPAVDRIERDVEQFVIRMLALRQPVAGDLRQIVASLKIASDFERIGDYAANVAKRSIVLNQFNLPFKLGGLTHLARLVQENLKLTVDAVGDSDPERAIQVWRADQVVDDIYTAIFRELITYMMEDPRNITPCTHLLFMAKNLERIGDHTTNIAETIHYAATGESLPEGRPKGESSAYTIVRPREP
jgi:phosphate transport system protein